MRLVLDVPLTDVHVLRLLFGVFRSETMVYIAPDGSVHQTRPWSLGRVVDIFWGTINFVPQFFTSLLGYNNNNAVTGGNRQGGAGGGGSGGPGGRPPNVRTMSDIRPAGGGCSTCPG